MSKGTPQPSRNISATLAFFLGIVGADLFYRRKYLAGLGVFAILIASYALSPVTNIGQSGVSRYVPMLLILYGWFRAFMYIRSKEA